MPGKIIQFDDETRLALNILAKNREATLQELADEAFSDLLKKHHIPLTLKEALKESLNGRQRTDRRRPPQRRREKVQSH